MRIVNLGFERKEEELKRERGEEHDEREVFEKKSILVWLSFLVKGNNGGGRQF